MKEHKDLEIKIKPVFEISIREYDKKRCSWHCQFARKISGNYVCKLFDKNIDEGDDEIRDDYFFKRTDECKELTND